MIFPEPVVAAEAVTAEGGDLGDSLAFDYARKAFTLIDGSPARLTGQEAVKQWLELFCRTTPGRYGVYGDTGFGVDGTALIGKKVLPNGAILSELKRQITEGTSLCPAVREVYGFNLSGNALSFTAVLKDGETEVLEVEL